MSLRRPNGWPATGDREASFLLGSAYGEGLAVTQDHEQAVSWYRKAAEQGNSGIAQSKLGVDVRVTVVA